jgi:hypothetical protein
MWSNHFKYVTRKGENKWLKLSKLFILWSFWFPYVLLLLTAYRFWVMSCPHSDFFVDFLYNLLPFFVIFIYLCLTLQCDVKVLAIVTQHLSLLLKVIEKVWGALKVIVIRCVTGYCKDLKVVKVMKFFYCV